MAADGMLTLPPLPAPVAAASPAAGSAGGVLGASAPSHAAAGAESAARNPGAAESGAPQDAQTSDQGASGRKAKGGNGPDASGSRSTGQAGSTGRDDASRGSSTGQGTARPADSSSVSSSQASPAAAGKDGFSAALAQSLAATPADRAPPAAAAATAAKAGSESGKDEASAHAAKHSASDPVASALALLEHALAGALMSTPQVPGATTSAASTGGASASAPSASPLVKGAAALEAQLSLKLPAEAKAGGTAPDPATGTPSPGAAAAALTAAQLTAGAHVGLQGRPEPTSMALSSPVGSSAWNDELGGRLTWMAQQGIESASLQLSPEHLGPVQVSISVHNGQASVWFGAAQADTRSALQQSLPQLRQLFAGQGLTLADAGVSREPPRGQNRQSTPRGAAPVGSVGAVSSEGAAGRTMAAGGLALLDTYA